MFNCGWAVLKAYWPLFFLGLDGTFIIIIVIIIILEGHARKSMAFVYGQGIGIGIFVFFVVVVMGGMRWYWVCVVDGDSAERDN